MSYCDRKRQVALILTFVAIMLVGLVVSADAGIKVNIGDSRDQYERFLARTENLSMESARKLTAYVERTNNARIIDEWELPTGTIIDYYHVGQQKPGGPEASYNGSAVVVHRDSRLGQAYLRRAYAELSFTERVNKWLGDIFVPNNHIVLVPVGLLEPGQMTQMVAAMAGATETRKIAIIATEFPPWDNRSPDQGGSQHRAGFADRYWSAYEVVQTGALTPLPEAQLRAYPMCWNLDVDFSGTIDAVNVAGVDETTYQSEWKPDWYADSTGGPMTVYNSGRCNPAGLHSPAWEGTASATMPGTPTWYSIETSNQNWTEFDLQNAWWNLIFNRSNSNSLTNYYYANSHGKITIEGDRSDITGWVRSGHVLDRHEFARNWLYAQQPGTPLIRPFYVKTPHAEYQQRIVRASLDENALTVLFAEDTSAGSVQLYAYQQDLNGVTSGDQPGYTRIYGEAGVSLGTDHYSDVYDGRRHKWTNSGWEYQRTSSSGHTYVDFDAIYADGRHWYMTVGNYKWGRPGGPPTAPPIDSPSNWAAAYPFAPNQPGMGFTPGGWLSVYTAIRRGAELYNTTFEIQDVYATSAAATQAWVATEGGAGPVPTQALFGSYNGDGVNYGLGNRLKAFWYYHHDHSWIPSKPTYQLAHLENAAGNIDDIGGTVDASRRHASRPYPFNCDASDSPNHGFGFRPGGADHNANNMVDDIKKVLEDNGIDPSWPGYDSIAYLFPSSAGGDDENSGFRMIPRCAGFGVLLPESSGLTLAAHEFGHCLFNFVDLYDQDFYNNYMTMTPPDPRLKECLGLGPYSVMTRGCSGVRVDAWHKIGANWVDPLDITEDRLSLEIPQIEGTLRDPVVLRLPANPYDILKGTAPAAWEEYFLVENRYQVGGDYFGDPSPQGLYIYHVDDRQIRYAPRHVSRFQVEERALSVAMVQADGRMDLETYDMRGLNPIPGSRALGQPDSYAIGDPFPGADIVRSFSQLPTLLDSVSPQRWSPKSWSHGDVIDSGPLGTVVIKAGTPTDSFTRVVNISDPSTTMTADVFVKPREIIVTDVSGDAGIAPTLAAGANLTQGDTLQGILALKLANPQYVPGSGDFSKMSTGEVVVNSVKILESGTAEQNAGEDHPAVGLAYLYAETGLAVGLQTSGANADSRIGTATFGNYDPYLEANVPDYAVFTSLGYRVPPDEERIIYIAYDILDDAQINPEITVGAELTDYTFMIPAAPGAVCERIRNGAEWDFGSYYFPMVSATSLIIEKPDVLEVTPNPPDPGAGFVAPEFISQGTDNVPLLQLQMHVTTDEVIVKNMKVEATTGAGWIDATDDLNVIRLHVDTNGDGLIDAGDALLAEANFSLVGGVPQALLQLAAVAPLSLRTIQAGTDQYWLLSVDVEDKAPADDQVQIKLLTADYITLVTNPSHPPAQQDKVSALNFTEDGNGDPLPDPPGTLVKSSPSTIVDDPPGEPLNLVAEDTPTDQGDSIDLSFSASPDDGVGAGDVTEYRVYRTETQGDYTGVPAVLTIPATGDSSYSCHDATAYSADPPGGPVTGTAYYYIVKAFDGRSESGASNEAGPVTPEDNIAPAPPTNVTAADPKDGTLDVSWTLSVDDGGGADDVTEYHIYRSTDNTDFSAPYVGTAAAGETSFSDATVTYDEEVYYMVRAYDGWNESVDSNVAGPTKSTDEEPPIISDLQPDDGDTGVARSTKISFVVTDGGSGVDKDAIDEDNVEVTVAGVAVPGSVVTGGDAARTTVEFTPDAPFAYDQVVSVSAKDIVDKAATPNKAATKSWSFTIEGEPVSTISGHVLDEDDKPIADTEVTLMVRGQEVTGKVGADGSYTIAGVFDGTYDVQARAEHGGWYFTPEQREVTVPPDQSDVDFTGQPLYSIAGQVVGDDGVGKSGALITASETSGGAEKSQVTDADGNFCIEDLLAGTYRVVPVLEGFDFITADADGNAEPDGEPYKDVTLGPNATDVNFVALSYDIAGQVVDDDGVGKSGVLITVSEQSQVTAAEESEVTAVKKSQVTDADGNFCIEDLLAGTYRVEPVLEGFDFVTDDADANPYKDVTLGPNATDVNFVASVKRHRLSGTIQTSTGGRMENVTVTAKNTDTGVSSEVLTGPSGLYVFDLTRGTYEVTPASAANMKVDDVAVDTDYQFEPLKQTVELPPQKTDVDFVGVPIYEVVLGAGLSLVAVPITPQSTDFRKAFGANTPVARWDGVNGQWIYNETPDDPLLELAAGRGYFVKPENAITNGVAGVPIPTGVGYDLQVTKSWTMVGNPYPAALPWSNVSVPSGGAVKDYGFIWDRDAEDYRIVAGVEGFGILDTVPEGAGFWMHATTAATVRVEPLTGLAAVDRPRVALALGDGDYVIPVQAGGAGRADTCAAAGIVKAADKLPGGGRLINPPPTGSHVDLYFIGAGGSKLCYDLRASAAATETWDFEVVTDIGDVPVAISLPDLSRVPAAKQVTLVDTATGKHIYARTTQQYTYQATKSQARRFKLEIGPRTVGSLVISAASSASRGGLVALTYTLSQRANVNITVMNISGRRIKCLVADKPATSGANTELWDLTSARGTIVPAGRYLITIVATTDTGQQTRALVSVQVNR